MPRADSTIRVNIIGDAKGLTTAADKAEGSVKGMNKALVKAGAIIAGAFAVDALVDFGQTALDEADRLGDATQRIEDQLGDLAQPLKDTADGFVKLGLSSQDTLELEAALVDVGTALGIADDKLAAMAPKAAEAAAALALLGIGDTESNIGLIGKAAAGSEKALRALGISLTDSEVEARALADTGKTTAESLTESELASARLELILEKLQPRIVSVTEGSGDLEQKQAELQARFEDLTAKIGTAIQGPLTDFLGWLITTAQWLDSTGLNAEGLAEDIDQITDAVKTLLSPLATAVDLLRAFASLAPNFGAGNPNLNPLKPTPRSSPTPGRNPYGATVNVNVQGGSPEAIEQAVQRAVNTYARRNWDL